MSIEGVWGGQGRSRRQWLAVLSDDHRLASTELAADSEWAETAHDTQHNEDGEEVVKVVKMR